MQAEQTYNGWTNHATWNVALHLDNDQGTYTMIRERADELKAEAPEHHNVPSIWTEEEAVRFELADYLEELAKDMAGVGENSEDYGMPEPSLLAMDLILSALGEVNWDEIARNILSES